jgi:hypothetical protein
MSQPPPEALASWLAVFTYLCVAITSVIVAVKHITGRSSRTEITGQPLEVKEASSFATKPELNSLENRTSGEIHQLHGRISGLRTEMSDKVQGLESRLEAKIGALEERIDGIPQATIELLKTIKEYHKS